MLLISIMGNVIFICMNKYLFEDDYSADSLKWIKRLEEKQLKLATYNQEEIDKFQTEIIQENDSALAYFFACEFPYKRYRMQKIILDNKDPKYSYLFAQNIENADIKALQKIVIDSKKIKYICRFACFVENADVKPLEKLIIKSKNVKYAHMYIKHVKGADINNFKKLILESKKPRYLFELAKHTTDPQELIVIEDLIIATKSFTYMRLMAEKIKLANVEKIEQAILDTDNTNEIKRFASGVKKSKMKKFLLVL